MGFVVQMNVSAVLVCSRCMFEAFALAHLDLSAIRCTAQWAQDQICPL